MFRTGVSDERILEVVSKYDAIGITSIFSQQETQVLHCAKIIKNKFPKKLLFSGGVNAKSRSSIFFAAGFDIIFTSESENFIKQVVKIMQKESRDSAVRRTREDGRGLGEKGRSAKVTRAGTARRRCRCRQRLHALGNGC